MSQRSNKQRSYNESDLQLALQAIQQDATLSARQAAKIFNVPRRTLNTRRNGIQLRRDTPPNSIKLLKTEEEVIVEYILDLDARGFPPRLAVVKDIANSLLAERYCDLVGEN